MSKACPTTTANVLHLLMQTWETLNTFREENQLLGRTLRDVQVG